MFKHIKHKNKHELREIGQSIEVRMAFCKETEPNIFTDCHQNVKCRDFFTDILITNVYPKTHLYPKSLYGLQYDHKENPIDLERTCISIKGKVEYINNIKTNIEILHKIERNANLILTQIIDIDPKTIIFIGDKQWMTTTFILHSYTFMVKCLAHPLPNKDIFKDVISWRSNSETPYKSTEGTYLTNKDHLFTYYYVMLRDIINYPWKTIIGDRDPCPDLEYAHHIGGLNSFIQIKFKELFKPQDLKKSIQELL